MMIRTHGAFLLSVLAFCSLAGCGSQSPPATVPAPARLSAATIDLITNSGDFPVRRNRVDEVEVSLTRQCMRSAGFAWAGVADELNPDAGEGRAVSLDHVRRHGYGLSEEPSGDGPEKEGPVADKTASRTALLGPEEDLVHLTPPGGVEYSFPRQGCAAQSHIAIYGDLDTWARIFYLPQEINLSLYPVAKADPRYTAKLRQWSACMAERHYAYESPEDAAEKLAAAYRSDRRPLEQRRAAEIKIAVQDALCDKQVRMSATALAVRRELAQRTPPSDRIEMTRLTALFDAAEKRSEALSR